MELVGHHQAGQHTYNDSPSRKEKGTEILFEEIMLKTSKKLNKLQQDKLKETPSDMHCNQTAESQCGNLKNTKRGAMRHLQDILGMIISQFMVRILGMQKGCEVLKEKKTQLTKKSISGKTFLQK